MAVIPDFPKYDIEGIDAAGKWVLWSASDTLDTMNRRVEQISGNVLAAQHPWTGTAAEQWTAVVQGRRDDLGLANSAMIKLGVALTGLASDLRRAKSDYDNAVARARYMLPNLNADGVSTRTTPTEQEKRLLQPAHDAIDLVAPALQRAAEAFDDASELAEGITASGANSRLPGVPAGTDRSLSSMELLSLLFGSLAQNRAKGMSFEGRVLQDFGMTKNNASLWVVPWRGSTIPDGLNDKTMVEVKNWPYVWNKSQIQRQMEYARRYGLEYRLVMPKNGRISADLQTALNNHPNADWYQDQGNGIYRSGTSGKYYRVAADGSLEEVEPVKDKNDKDNFNPPTAPPPPAPATNGQPVPNLPDGGYVVPPAGGMNGVPVPELPGLPGGVRPAIPAIP